MTPSIPVADSGSDAVGRHAIVVGVDPDEPGEVLWSAVEFARAFASPLVFVGADPARYGIRQDDQGRVVSLSVNPDLTDEQVETFPPELVSRIAACAAAAGILWSVRAVAGDPALELMRVADQVDATMLIVGSRKPGVGGSVREFLNGSVAAKLAHRQSRPVVIVPLSPVAKDDELPWSAHV